ncbi:hypothetical protein [Microvirga yunnanensis]|uniref:hypothetical protein n=1 Tax=Microvirga yunnanensis TaxID=2953740 RepID=UPI0021C57971|nr:hypothetical protein [Microvirga sp. HBU65207]
MFAWACLKGAEAFFGDYTGPLHFVTIACRRFSCAVDGGAAFDVQQVQSHARQALHGFNYLGMVEVAYYGNIGLAPGVRGALCFHVHAIVWGVSAHRLNRALAAVDAREQSLLPGVRPTDRRSLTVNRLPGKLLYMLKSPSKEYRVYPMRGEFTDQETGEITVGPTGKWRQLKQRLRFGGLVAARSALVDRYLDRLAFAGGAGISLLNRIRCAALRPLRAYQKSRCRLRRSLR